MEKSPETWSAYKKKHDQMTNEMCISIKDHCHGLTEKIVRDPKKMWQTMNKVLDQNRSRVPLSGLEIDGKSLTREPDVVELVNHHLALVSSTSPLGRRSPLSQVVIASVISSKSPM